VLDETSFEEIDLNGIGRLLALTSNDEVNALAALHAIEAFGRAEVYQLPLRRRDTLPEQEVPGHLHGRYLFDDDATYARLERLYETGAVIKTTTLTREFDYAAFRNLYGDDVVPLFVIDPNNKRLTIFTTDTPLTPVAGQVIISMAMPQGTDATNGKTPVTAGETNDGQRAT
jgi:hypothetical protein